MPDSDSSLPITRSTGWWRRTSARTRRLSTSSCRGDWRSNSCLRARWQSASGPAGQASQPSTRRLVSALRSLKDARFASSTESNYLLERGILADFALVRAWKGDSLGNLVYRRTARNFNPLAAMAGRVTIAEVEELVEIGDLDGDTIHTPGVFVQHVVRATTTPKQIERRTTRMARLR